MVLPFCLAEAAVLETSAPAIIGRLMVALPPLGVADTRLILRVIPKIINNKNKNNNN